MQTVLSKLIVGLLLIPVVYLVIADITSVVAAFILSIRARAAIGFALWQPDLWLKVQLLWVYLIIVSAIWYLPVAGYLMVVSAWAKRAVLLWAVLPPLALYLMERVFFGGHLVANILSMRLVGLLKVALNFQGHFPMDDDPVSATTDVLQFINASGFFSDVQTWIGAAVGVALIFVAIQLRMRRSEI